MERRIGTLAIMDQTINQLLHQAAARFSGSASPVLDAQVLLAGVLACQRSHLLAWPDKVVPGAKVQSFEALVRRREDGEPVAYLTGTREFWSLELEVTPDTLVPRAETETLVARALALLPVDAPSRVAEPGTGSGAVASAIASERPAARVVATDISEPALAVARRNASTHGIDNVRFVSGDWLAPLAGERFDLIASNPPYVNAADPCLTQGDTAFEPPSALAAGPDGLAALRTLIAAAPRHLSDSGTLLLEHGSAQAAAVTELMAKAGFAHIATHADLAGLPRCTEAHKLL
ncbi:MAG: peptide chain release factor N(5)-glutamine methyltransferase [Pseudomonadota bacterium]